MPHLKALGVSACQADSLGEVQSMRLTEQSLIQIGRIQNFV